MAAARQVRVQRFAANVLPVIREVQGAGHKSFNAIAGHLSVVDVYVNDGGQAVIGNVKKSGA